MCNTLKATFHLTISICGQRATGKIQRNIYYHGSCGPSLTGKTSSVSLIFTHWTHRNVKNRWVRSSLKNDFPSNGSVILKKKTDWNRTCSIFIRHSPCKMQGTDKFCMTVLAPNWRFFVSSEKQIVWTHHKWPSDILTTKTKPWNRTVWTPASSFMEPKVGSLKTDRLNGPLYWRQA